jgi:CBS domain-containing protein
MPLDTTPLKALLARKPVGVHSVSSDQTVSEAVDEMNRNRIGCVLVQEDGKLVGIFTERDVLTRVVARVLDPRSTPVQEVMTPGPKSVSTRTTVGEAMRLMTDSRTRHLPVFDEADDSLAGLISIGDVTRWQIEENQAEAEHLKKYVFGEISG